MLTAPTAPWSSPAADRGSAHGPDAAAPVGCGGWYASSIELKHGLCVTEHDGLPVDCDTTLWDLLSFE